MKTKLSNAVIAALTAAQTLFMGTAALAQSLKPVSQEQIAKINAIIPEKLAAAPRDRKILVFWRCEGYVHGAAIAYSIEAFKLIGQKYSAYEFEFSREYADLSMANLKKYDALILNNTTHLNTKDNATLESDLIDFVQSGKGLVVIHAGADNFYQAEAAAAMVGGLFAGHPWGAGGTWAFKLDEPDHPINSTFPQPRFKWSDEIYQQKSPYYDRSKLRVLISLDLGDKATAAAKGQNRADNDYAVSWIRPFGKGRVFYTSFAHDQRAFLDGAVFGHIINGLQYALGDLKADDTPTRSSNETINRGKRMDQERQAMVMQLRDYYKITDQRVLDAMSVVRRHLYFPEAYRSQSSPYGDHPAPIGYNQTISQPYIVAYMTQSLNVQPGESILEIGAGSGYQAAVLAEMGAKVYSVEIVPELAKHARQILAAEGYSNAHILMGDGYNGWAQHAPYDAAIVACAPEEVPQKLVDQLKENGRMILPLGSSYSQRLVILRKIAGKIHLENDLPVRFVPMVKGKSAQSAE